jgi:hypothetical protein
MEVKTCKDGSMLEEMGEEREEEGKRRRNGKLAAYASSDKQGRLVLAVNNKRLLLVMMVQHPHMHAHGTQQLCLITGKELDELSQSGCVCELASSISSLPRQQLRPARPDCVDSSP